MPEGVGYKVACRLSVTPVELSTGQTPAVTSYLPTATETVTLAIAALKAHSTKGIPPFSPGSQVPRHDISNDDVFSGAKTRPSSWVPHPKALSVASSTDHMRRALPAVPRRRDEAKDATRIIGSFVTVVVVVVAVVSGTVGVCVGVPVGVGVAVTVDGVAVWVSVFDVVLVVVVVLLVVVVGVGGGGSSSVEGGFVITQLNCCGQGN